MKKIETFGTTDRITLLFVLGHEGYFRNFQDVIEKLALAGLRSHVCFTSKHKSIELSDYRISEAARPLITFQEGTRARPTKRDTSRIRAVWNGVRLRLRETARAVRDIVFYSRKEFDLAPDLRSRVAAHQNTRKPGDLASGKPEVILSARALNWLLSLMTRPPLCYFRGAANSCLAKLERMLAPDAFALETVRAIQPNLVVVSPFVDFGSRTVDFVKAAHALGIPSLLAVASWDNLSNKGVMKFTPKFVSVWNQTMADEAKALHDFPQDRVWITGAPLFDKWFGRSPKHDRATFASKFGFDPKRPIILYACSSPSIAGDNESDIARGWTAAIRASSDSEVAMSNLLIRPYPMSLATWASVKASGYNQGEFHTAIVWPLAAKHPSNEERASDLFESLYHADVVVGLNTSLMIEAAILRKPVMTFFDHEREQGQTGNLHFRHLANAKVLLGSMTLEEHVTLMSDVLRNRERFAAVCDQFIEDFVRPFGRDKSATDEFARRVTSLCKYRLSEGSAAAASDA